MPEDTLFYFTQWLKNRCMLCLYVKLCSVYLLFIYFPQWCMGARRTMYRRHIKILEKFHHRKLSALFGNRCQDHITNLARAGTTNIKAKVQKIQLRWVALIPDDQLPKQIFYSELKLVSRSAGQWKRFKDTLKVSLKKCNVDLAIWEGKAANRADWQQTQSRCCTSWGI